MRFWHSIDPFIIRIYGDIGIRWYSLPYLLGFFLLRATLVRAARRGEIQNLDEGRAESYVGWAFVAALIGARFFHVFIFEFRDYGLDPLAWIAVWRGGLSFHGGLVGVVLATVVICRKYKIRFYDIADRGVLPIAIALGFGRIANFINAEMYGTIYHGGFCVDYSRSEFLRDPPLGCRHPVQLYEMLKNWVIAVLLITTRNQLRPPSGMLFWMFIGLYGFVRYWLMYLRVEPRIWAGLTESQIFSGIMAIVGMIAVAALLMSARRQPSSARGNSAI